MDPSSGFTGTPAAVKSCANVGGAAEFIASETFWFRFRCCSPVVLVVVFVDTFFPAPPPFAVDEGVIITSLTYTRSSIISLSLHSPATTKRFFSLNTSDDARNKVKRTTRETTLLRTTKTLSFSLNRPRKRVSLSRRTRRQFFPITLANAFFFNSPSERFHALYLSLNKKEKKKKTWKKSTSCPLLKRLYMCVKSVCVYTHTQNTVKRERRCDDPAKLCFGEIRSTFLSRVYK